MSQVFGLSDATNMAKWMDHFDYQSDLIILQAPYLAADRIMLVVLLLMVSFLHELSDWVLSMKYQLGTGDRRENMGHTATVQLKWNSAEIDMMVNGMFKSRTIVEKENLNWSVKIVPHVYSTPIPHVEKQQKKIDFDILKNNKRVCLSFESTYLFVCSGNQGRAGLSTNQPYLKLLSNSFPRYAKIHDFPLPMNYFRFMSNNFIDSLKLFQKKTPWVLH